MATGEVCADGQRYSKDAEHSPCCSVKRLREIFEIFEIIEDWRK